MIFNLIVCGGTFDHFHKGHEVFLSHALSLGGRLIVGLTSIDYIKSAKCKTQSSKSIEDFKIREKSVKEFLAKKKVQDRTEIVRIDDLFGPTLSKDLLIDAIAVSQDSKKGAEIINQKRKGLGLKDLKIIIAPLILAEDGKIISSGRIRKGEIDRNGKPYVKPIWLKKDLILPENLRDKFKKPFGVLINNLDQEKFKDEDLIITVGDVTSKLFSEKSVKQSLSVVDFRVRRIKKFSSILELGFKGNEKTFNVNNPAGSITSDLFKTISEIFKTNLAKKIILQINGEEDLAVLPLVLTAPLGAVVYYGQPNEGLVRVMVSEKSKNEAYNLVSKLRIT